VTPWRERLPRGYARFRVGDAETVSLAPLAETVAEAMADGPLYSYAAQHPRARPLAGRGIAYAVPLPDATTNVVVRHSRHGGMLAKLTGDRFLAPSRAPYELDVAARLTAEGIRTPEVVAFALYPAGPMLRRSDVATREVPRAKDLALALLGPMQAQAKREILAATARLVVALNRAGARHPDLNLKNVLLAPSAADGSLEAWVLDVDRMEFGRRGDPAITDANLARLSRSARKWRELYGANVEEADLEWLIAESRG
jgi:hypothetical protein